MKEELITFETAKLAKEKGFTQHVTGSHVWNYYNDDGSFGDISCGHFNLDQPIMCSQSLLQKWLREEHNINIEISYSAEELFTYIATFMMNEDIYESYCHIKTYEEALEKGLQESLKLIEL